MGVLSYLLHKLKSQDLYAKSVNLTFDGKDKLQTTYGGFISLMIKISIIVNAIILIIVIFKKNDTK